MMNVTVLKSIIIAFLLCIVAVGIFTFVGGGKSDAPAVEESKYATMTVGTTTVRLIVADTDERRVRGLSGHAPLDLDEAMLFVFDSDAHHAIWMKDMLFPIDIIWLDAEGKVVHIKESAIPESYPEVFTPPVPARYVLEANAGFARRHGIDVGTALRVSAY